jgi:hypothetical protein
MMLTEAGASLDLCSYLEAPETEGSSSKRIISSWLDSGEDGPVRAWASAGAGWRRTAAAARLSACRIIVILLQAPVGFFVD